MPQSHAIIKVILRSGKEIESPILPREEADADLATINERRMQGGDAVLSWLSVMGADIEAAHLEERRDPSSGARARLG